MRYSYKLQIHDLTWTVKFVKRECDKLDKACGITYKDDLKIYIDEELPEQLKKRTLRHEITHAYVWSYGLENISVRKFEEEDLCNFVESYGDPICKDTETIFNWAIKLLKEG